MTVLVTGVKGQLGHDVVLELNRRGIPCLGVDQEDFDIADPAAVEAFFAAHRPEAVVHAAAYTNVDGAEANRELAFQVNGRGTENLARAAEALGAKFVYISTDYVFSGVGDRPWQPNDPTAPCNAYGESKLAGEKAVLALSSRAFIVRTSWVFGINGKNFVKTMLRLGAEKEELKVVSDQIGSPTYTPDLAWLLCDMLETERYGIYHAANSGLCSWYAFASRIMELGGRGARVLPVTSEEYAALAPAAAHRPKNSRLDRSCLTEAGFAPLPPWEDALKRYLAELGELKEIK